VDWIYLTQGWVKCWAHVNMAVDIMGCIMLTDGEACGQMRKYQLMDARVNHVNRPYAINTIAAVLQYGVSTYSCSSKSNIAVANWRKV